MERVREGIYLGSCIDLIKKVEDCSINTIISDLPYGVTRNSWDTVIPFDIMWREFERILVPNGKAVLTANMRFGSNLVVSNNSHKGKLKFRYDVVWQKTIGSGQLNIGKRPLLTHELILVFEKPKATYNEIMTKGDPYKIDRDTSKYSTNYNGQKKSTKTNEGYRHPKSIVKVPNPRIKGGHPTQKPESLMDNLVFTHSNLGDLILDPCMGSGTTGVSCKNLGRKFIGFELNKKYFDMAKLRMS